uniref:AraC effector-binding domain-containing protein n=1 Tax=Spongospora subterranea TaxID=70186 RepID=A0A0H5RCV5_9EUKA|eukprot:CRZ11591.1 hypothetical protein [Spongospora subterranea]
MEQIVVRTVPRLKVVSLRERISDFKEQGRLWGELHGFADQSGLVKTGPGLTLLHSLEPIEVEICIPVDQCPQHDRFHVRVLPEQLMAVNTFRGPMHNVSEAYVEMQQWLKEKGHTVVGPSREVYIKIPTNCTAQNQNPEPVHVEVQFPIGADA